MDSKLNTTDAYASIKIKDFRWFVCARFILTFGIQMQSLIVGWQIYQLTHDALSLGLIGLSEALPFLSITLYGGHIADKTSRKKIILYSNLIYFICALALLGVSTQFRTLLNIYGTLPIYIIIVITGFARGFMGPAQSSFVAQLIPRELYGNAYTWNSLAWQIAEVSGPAAGGLIYGFFGIGSAYLTVVILSAIGFLFYTRIAEKPIPQGKTKETIWQSLTGGLKFVFKDQIILSAITLDMFAVFFGGAVAVLPIFADQVLRVGAKGLGFLRAAPAVGEIIMSVIQVHKPFFKNAGRNLLLCVFGFGIAIILFALSKSFYFSLFLLFLSGLFDNVSVVIRSTIIQLFTPDEVRGRVSSVNGIFISSSNELGSFESGVAAKFIGLVPSVIFGGSMTLVVVALVRKFAPKLRTLKI